MDEFNFSEIDIDDAFRRVCQKIDILGETQVIDRILFQISQRYWDCNEKMRNVFLTVGIVKLTDC
jgi:Sec7-like guanine-nucleotide exchange factor